MENLLTYILQVNLLLALVFLGYQFLLKNLTFYILNRLYFIIGALYALVYPLIDFKSWLVRDTAAGVPVLWDYVSIKYVEQLSKTYSLYDVLLLGIVIGSVIFVAKLFMQLGSLLRVHFYSKKAVWQDYLFRNVLFPIVPFSFFNKIYIHKDQHQDAELNDIFEHETVHVKGLHTWDVLLFEILLIGCWYNPLVWLMRKAIRQNLEFLTDQQVLNKGVDRQTYQYSLLNVTQRGAAVNIGNQFNFKTLKRRIMMMNKKRSSKLELSKYAFLLPIMLLAGASFAVSQAESKIENVVDLTKETPVLTTTVVKPTEQVDTTDNQVKEYPLLAPDFDKEKVAKMNNYYEIDGKLVSLDEFLAFPKMEIAGVDIYKDKGEIYKKIGKPNADALFVMTSKKGTNFTVKSDVKKSQQEEDFKRLNSKNEIDAKKSYLYDYDGKLISKTDFLAISDNELKQLTLTSNKSLLQDKYGKNVSNADSYDGVIMAYSAEGERKQKERLGNVLFVIDGKEMEKGFDVHSLNPNDILSVYTLKGNDATDKYGDKGKNGVMLITLKKASDIKTITIKGTGSNVNNDIVVKSEYSDDLEPKEVIVVGYKGKGETMAIQAKPVAKGTVEVFVKSATPTSGRINLKGVSSNGNNLLFVIDGKEMAKDFDLSSFNQETIESITVLKDESAEAVYGDKGKNGVILIQTKEAKKNSVDEKIKDSIQKEIKEARNK